MNYISELVNEVTLYRYEYKVIVSSFNKEVFEKQVTQSLNEGWELAGNVVISDSSGLTQPMLKRVKL